MFSAKLTSELWGSSKCWLNFDLARPQTHLQVSVYTVCVCVGVERAPGCPSVGFTHTFVLLSGPEHRKSLEAFDCVTVLVRYTKVRGVEKILIHRNTLNNLFLMISLDSEIYKSAFHKNQDRLYFIKNRITI